MQPQHLCCHDLCSSEFSCVMRVFVMFVLVTLLSHILANRITHFVAYFRMRFAQHFMLRNHWENSKRNPHEILPGFLWHAYIHLLPTCVVHLCFASHDGSFYYLSICQEQRRCSTEAPSGPIRPSALLSDHGQKLQLQVVQQHRPHVSPTSAWRSLHLLPTP